MNERNLKRRDPRLDTLGASRPRPMRRRSLGEDVEAACVLLRQGYCVHVDAGTVRPGERLAQAWEARRMP